VNDVDAAAPYLIEPLGDHDRLAFSCGVPELDHYLHVQARQDAKRKVAAPFVLVDTNGIIVGYYTLSAYTVRLGELPQDVARRLPKYPLIPATLLGRLAVDRAHHGRRLGKLLLMDALLRSWKSTEVVASVGVVAEAMNDAARAFYESYKFIPLTDQPRKLFLAMRTIQKAFS
jgi:GNAT superfamily N-acetyltransferase